MRIVASSDWHLDAVTSGVERWEEVEAAIDHSVELAKSEKADLYVMAGDVCNPDSHCAVRAVKKTIEVARRFALAGIASGWVGGTHAVCAEG